jgi:hypothetical protein
MRSTQPSSDGRSAGNLGAQSFVDFVQVWNSLQGLTTPSLHQTIVDWLGKAWDAGLKRLLLMIFRGAGKSTLVGLFCAWLLSRNPDLRILIISADHALATKMTRTVRQVVRSHPRTNHLVDGAEEWAADRFTVRRPSVQRDPSLLARGIGGNVTGSRADVLICDDVEVPGTSETPGKREALREALRELAFVLVPSGMHLYAGTPHCYDSIYAERPGEPPFLANFLRLILPVIDSAGEPAWPERFSPEHIDALRLASGPAQFRSQMLLVPTHAHETRLDADRLVAYDAELETVLANGRAILRIGGQPMVSVACWWDPALGRPERGDASVVAVVFRDAEDTFWLHDILYLGRQAEVADGPDEATRLCREVAEFLRRNEVPQIIVEANGIGGFLPGILRRELASAGLGVTVLDRHTSLPKARRILEAFDPVLAARRLRAHRRVWQTPFIEEMREWAPHTNGPDDGLDAVAGCLRQQPVPARPSRPGLRRPAWRADLGGTAIIQFEV